MDSLITSFGAIGGIVIFIFGFVLAVLAVLMPLYIYQMHYRLKRMETLFQQYCKDMDSHLRFANQHLKSLASADIESQINNRQRRSL